MYRCVISVDSVWEITDVNKTVINKVGFYGDLNTASQFMRKNVPV